MAATGVPFYIPAVAANGTVASSFKVNGWVPTSAGAPTATRRTFYTDAELTTPAANPATLGASGRVFYVNPALSYAFTITDAAGAVTYDTIYAPPYTAANVYTQTEANALSPGPNLFPNSGFDYWPEIDDITARNAACTADIAATSVSANTLANPSVFTIADTSLLVSGWIYTASAAASANLKITPMRAQSIVTNTSATFYPPLGRVPAGTSAFTITPRTPGDRGTATGNGPAQWTKTAALYMWCDRNSVNQHRGSWCTVALEKTASTVQEFYWQVPTAILPDMAGRDITQSWAVQHKIKTGSAGPRCFMQINGGARVYGDATTTTGAFESLQQSATLSSTLTSLAIGIELPATTMASGDVCHLAMPMLAFGTALPSFFYTRDRREVIRGTGHCLPDGWAGAALTFPSSLDASGSDYSILHDPHAETSGRISPRVREIDCVIEASNGTPNIAFSSKSSITSPTLYGPRFYSVEDSTGAATMVVAKGTIFLDVDGFVRWYSATSAAAFTSTSLDYNSVVAE